MATNYLPENLDFLCKRRGISPKRVALDTGTYPSTLYRLLDKEKRTIPRVRVRKLIADYFNVDVFALIERDLSVELADTEDSAPTPPIYSKPPAMRGQTVPIIAIIDAKEMTMETLFDPAMLDRVREGNTDPDVPFKVVGWILPPPETDGKKLRAFRVRGASMTPTLCERDIVFLREEPTPATGTIALGLVNTDEGLAPVIRRYVESDTGSATLKAETGASDRCERYLGHACGFYREL